MREQSQTRRAVIAGVGVGGLAVAIAACGGETTTGGATSGATSEAASPTTPASSAQATSGGGGGSGSGALATTADIPVGGGAVFKDQKVVITQPTAGEFKGFSAVCTHQGCIVASVANGEIVCPCHGGKYKITDGSVVAGPPPKPLPEQAITVEGDNISLA
ncbi:Rieske (2Fe-2S) protein [Nonomuraea soli]|uniref:Cytochrome bc1 complex Rieske iron-sulfur subunit n=1 Tax=Nonomuraea soli TaxID=1032476 RepID=A0A7W0HUG4_9ACTN|nr:Rieske (2Fe-2S) protein [Nonomuraea soli]MBA2895942.1 Rieske Fe-S protein [Nonomuraea soli]